MKRVINTVPGETITIIDDNANVCPTLDADLSYDDYSGPVDLTRESIDELIDALTELRHRMDIREIGA